MGILAPICNTGNLTINSILMHRRGAWNIPDLHTLWLPTATKGANDQLAGSNGTAPNTWFLDEGVYPLLLGVAGTHNVSGTPYADPLVGLETNLAYLYTNVFVPPTYPTASRTGSLLMPGGSTRTGNVQPRDPEVIERLGPNMKIMFTLVVVAGRLA